MQQLIVTAPSTLAWSEYTDQAIGSDEVLIRVTHASPKTRFCFNRIHSHSGRVAVYPVKVR